MRISPAVPLILGAGVLVGCRTQDVIATDKTTAVRRDPFPRGHSLEFYTRNIPVYIDGERADSQALANLRRSEIDTVFVVTGCQAVAKYGEWARGKTIFEYILKPDPLSAAVNYAKVNILTRAGAGTYILDRRQILWPDEGTPGASRFGPIWPKARIEAVASNTGLQVGSLAEASRCAVNRTGYESCHLRPHQAAVAVGMPRVLGDSAYVQIHLWFHIGPPTTAGTRGENEVLHQQLLTLLVKREGNAWTVSRRVRLGQVH